MGGGGGGGGQRTECFKVKTMEFFGFKQFFFVSLPIGHYKLLKNYHHKVL